MKTLKYLGVATILAAGLATASQAADTVVFAGAGSSAMWQVFEQGASAAGFTSHYSYSNTGASSSNIYLKDVVNPSGTINNLPTDPINANNKFEYEKGNLWVAWKGVTGNYQIAYYISVDSTVGNRAFFKSDTLLLPAVIAAPDNTGYTGTPAGSQPDVALPSDTAFIAALQGSTIADGMTDITPADAKVATTRSLALGYSLTNPIKSGFGSGAATPISFDLTARSFTLVPVGAVPVVVFINTSDTTHAAGFGNIATTGGNLNGGTEFENNINRFTLGGFLSGQLGRTRDLFSNEALQSTPDVSVTTIDREPLSGTYNTMEYNIPESVEVSPFTAGSGQELNWPSTVQTVAGPGGSVRKRAIGTGESIKQGNLTANALGYAFWSTASFASAPHLRYLTVDGSEPLFDAYAPNEGSLQPTGTVTFRNIKNGGYPIWSILRVVADANTLGEVNSLIGNLKITDFVKLNELEVFRSYHATPDFGSPSNGNAAGTTATGGDVGGAVFPVNADIDFANDTSAELTGYLQ